MDQAVSQKKRWYLKWYMWILYAFILLIVFSINTAKDKAQQVAQNAETKPLSGGTTSTSGSEKLELVSYTCGREYGYFKITGQVKNISSKSMESVVAVGNMYTEDGTFVKSEEALIKYNPILVDQTSPFEVLGTDNPAIDKCQIEFKEFFGGTIPTKRAAQE